VQTTPSKNRAAITAGAIVLALAVGGYALWSANRGAKSTQQQPVAGSDYAPLAGDDTNTTAGTDTTPNTGETATGTETGSETATTAPGTVPEYHTVAAGDTLYDISRRYYNTHIYAGDIEALNHLENPDHLPVGQQLKLPRLEDLKSGQ
jgi:5'-nucleotidase/UDP-sugar diphosphatase